VRASRTVSTLLVLVVWVLGAADYHGIHAQATTLGETRIAETVTGQVDAGETGREAWGLSEADWESYQVLMKGPSGLWYPRLAPAMVLGINARTEAERRRYARMVWEQEKARLDALLAFNRAYQDIARSDRSRPGFSFFDALALPQSPVLQPRAAVAGRISAFVTPDCPECERQIRELTALGRPFDVYVVGAGSDRDIRIWAQRAGIPVERVVSRAITLNHDSGRLMRRAGHDISDLPLFFAGRNLSTPVSLHGLRNQQ